MHIKPDDQNFLSFLAHGKEKSLFIIRLHEFNSYGTERIFCKNIIHQQKKIAGIVLQILFFMPVSNSLLIDKITTHFV